MSTRTGDRSLSCWKRPLMEIIRQLSRYLCRGFDFKHRIQVIILVSSQPASVDDLIAHGHPRVCSPPLIPYPSYTYNPRIANTFINALDLCRLAADRQN